jgi:hypothetical protein
MSERESTSSNEPQDILEKAASHFGLTEVPQTAVELLGLIPEEAIVDTSLAGWKDKLSFLDDEEKEPVALFTFYAYLKSLNQRPPEQS